MNRLHDIYRTPLALLTDLYQLTMAYGYWQSGRAQREAVFHLSFRSHPFHGGYTLAAGLGCVLDYLDDFHFAADDIAYLATLTGSDDRRLFEPDFLKYLGDLRLACDVDAVPEGTVVFPHEPLLRVRGPILHCQILESALLNIVNYQSLIATKAARICTAAAGDPVVEFGLRRAQGIDGALAASRAAYLGGCAATSNVLAGKLYGIPVKGTHAHSWVMSFDDELTAFETYAAAMPNNCVFLVDTYDTLDGVRNAITVAQQLRRTGHKLVGIRLDSGDLAYLSIEARRLLDEAGLKDTAIMATNDLDEATIVSLKAQGAAIAVWGVGTRLVTAYDQPALGGVYKLGAVRSASGAWEPRVKLSEQAVKTSIPGILQVRRYHQAGHPVADMIYNELQGKPGDTPVNPNNAMNPNNTVMVDPFDPLRRRSLPADHTAADLLVPVVRQGKIVGDRPPLGDVREFAAKQIGSFHAGVRRLLNPHQYPVGLEKSLYELRTQLVLEARGTMA
ncbi:MAG: nicotinate phosphoribosyltransferase [Planctomycetia bacterium]|nr:nicotinate phosphoribosyltransferase [Planctomycetia bacterium]